MPGVRKNINDIEICLREHDQRISKQVFDINRLNKSVETLDDAVFVESTLEDLTPTNVRNAVHLNEVAIPLLSMDRYLLENSKKRMQNPKYYLPAISLNGNLFFSSATKWLGIYGPFSTRKESDRFLETYRQEIINRLPEVFRNKIKG
jgi:hypothetical protein